MYKKIAIISIPILIITILVILILRTPFSQELLRKRAFEKAVLSLSDDTKEIAFNDLVSFDWDYAYSFFPYVISDEEIDNILGFESNESLEIQSEGLGNLVFVKGNKVVCRLRWWPSDANYDFDFGAGEPDGFYCKISRIDNPIFKIEVKNKVKRFTISK